MNTENGSRAEPQNTIFFIFSKEENDIRRRRRSVNENKANKKESKT